MKSKYVKKAAGDIERFSHKKLSRYLKKIGVPESEISRVVNAVEHNSGEEVYTNQITKLVSDELIKIPNGEVYVTRYQLKPAIRKMGPAGHNFEKYVGRLFEADNHHVEVSVIVQGECVEHEVDVLATKENKMEIVEAKFHNREGTRSDITTALYIYARFLDINASLAHKNTNRRMWIATNTKLTTTAFKYAACKGIQILSLQLPHQDSITDRAIRDGLFPITSIPILEKFSEKLLREDIIVLDDLLNMDNHLAGKLGIPVDTLNVAQMQAARILDFTRAGQNSTKNS